MKRKHFFELRGIEGDDLASMQTRLTTTEEEDKANVNAHTAQRYYAIASNDALDRDDEILVPLGVDIRNFKTNPVLLHIHQYQQVPIGKVHHLDIDKDAVGMAFSFAEGTEQGDQLKYLYDNDYMRAFSVGFIPRGVVRIDEQTPNQIDVDLRIQGVYTCQKTGELTALATLDADECRIPDTDGKLVTLEAGKTFKVNDSAEDESAHRYRVDLTKYERRPKAVIARWELLEVSPVPIGSNPEALIQRCVGGMLRKYQDDPKRLALAKSAINYKLDTLITILEDSAREADTFEIKSALPAHSTPIDFDADWDAGQARATLARWASSDGTGAKDAIDWAKFGLGYAWFDPGASDAFTGYKLLHHFVGEDDQAATLTASWPGVATAMANLLSGSADVQGDELAVYEHLSRHYRDAGQDVPAFERDYTPDEINLISEGAWSTNNGPVAPHSTAIDIESPWEGQLARTNLRRWASRDGSGEVASLDWSKFALGFAYVDPDRAETLAAYALPHHMASVGELVANWRGVTTSMGALLGERGEVTIPEAARSGAYAHLARHYRDNDREPPPMARTYSDNEIRAIALDMLQFEVDDSGAVIAAVEVGDIDDLEKFNFEEVYDWSDASERAIVRTGSVNGHSHTVDNLRTGRTSNDNGHDHPYTAGDQRTGPGGDDNHRHPVPVASGNAVMGEKLMDMVKRLDARIEELDAEVSVRLGIMSDMLEEVANSVARALENDEKGEHTSGKERSKADPARPGIEADVTDTQKHEELASRGIVQLSDFLSTGSGD